MTYAEQIAVDLSRVAGVQPGSMTFHAFAGAVTEVIERCAKEAEAVWQSGTAVERIGPLACARRIRALAATHPVAVPPEPPTPGQVHEAMQSAPHDGKPFRMAKAAIARVTGALPGERR